MDNAPHQPWVLWLFAVGALVVGLAGVLLGSAIGSDRLGSGVLAVVGAAGSWVGVRQLDRRIAARKRLKHARRPWAIHRR